MISRDNWFILVLILTPLTLSFHPEPMPVSLEDVRKVSRLSRLSFTLEEEQQLVEDLNRILDYVSILERLDTKDVPPTAHVLPLSNVFRQDLPRPSLTQEEALANAPSAAMGHFKVPKMIE